MAANPLFFASMNAPASPLPTLTPAELQVLQLKVSGLSRKEVARKLGKSPETVKVQLRLAQMKLGAPDISSALAMAVNLGFITPRRYQGASACDF